MNTDTATHTLKCDGPSLVKGVRLERPWSCTCGAKFDGFDTAVRKAFAAHKRGA